MPTPRTPSKQRLTGFEHLEAREVPAASLLADLVTTPAPSFDLYYPVAGVGTPAGAVVNGSAVFAANDGTNAVALWKSDGTAAGTKLVAALPTAPGGPVAPWNRPGQFTAAGNKVYFAYSDGIRGNTVWATDGTAAGTGMVVDPAAPGNSPFPTLIGAMNGRLLFSMMASAGAGPSVRLYSTDGTAAGTTLVKDLGGATAPNYTLANGTLYFAAASPADPSVTSLWKSDGTAAGTKPVADLPAGVSAGYAYGGPSIAAVGNTVYFAGTDAAHGAELWAADAAGVRLVKDLNAHTGGVHDPLPTGNTNGSFAQQLVAHGGRLYFVADDGDHGQELWSTDGTSAGTAMVADLSAAGSDSSPFPFPFGGPTGSRVAGLRSVGGRLLFTADPGTGPQVYGSDGTAAGTAALTAVAYPDLPDPLPYPGYYPYTPPALVAGTAGGKVYFAAEGTTAGTVYGTTDGTAAGTRTVARINPNSLGSNPGSFTAVSDKLAVFVGTPGSGRYATLYATDGVAAPKPLTTFDQPVPDQPVPFADLTEYPDQLTAAGGKVYFLGAVGNFGRQLWATDGTAAGTKVLKELPTSGGLWGMYRSGLDNLTAGPGGVLYFTVDAAGSGQQLWKTDGTAAGTVLVKQVNAASTRDAGPVPATKPVFQLTVAGGRLFFAAGDGVHGDELWASDGTAAGTKQVKDLTPGSNGSALGDFAALGGKVAFTADDGTGRKLWVSDGTAAGTVAVATPAGVLGHNPFGPYSENFVSAGGKVYFPGRDAAGLQLWVTDGTAAGTRRVSNVAGVAPPWGGPGDPQVTGITAAGAKVYFVANDRDAGAQLFVSDGTAAGTRMVKKLGKGPAEGGVGSLPAAGLAVGDKLLFAADDGEHGRELWVTDGTAAGTRMVQDIGAGTTGGVGVGPGFVLGSPAAVVNGRVVFAADSGKTGAEPWAVPLTDLGIGTTPTPPPPTPGGKPTVVSVGKPNATVGASTLLTLGTVDLPTGPAYKVWVFWGDKEVSAGALTRTTRSGTTFTVTGTHAYAAAGAYKPQFRVTADGKTVLTVDTTAAVGDARFYAGRAAERVVAGRAFALPVATIRTLNPAGGQASDYTATIDWGDGTKSPATVRKTAAGLLEVVGEHTFAAPARRTVTVVIRSKGGTTATATSLFVVDTARPPRV